MAIDLTPLNPRILSRVAFPGVALPLHVFAASTVENLDIPPPDYTLLRVSLDGRVDHGPGK